MMSGTRGEYLVNLLTAVIVAGAAYFGVYSSNIAQAEIFQKKLVSERLKETDNEINDLYRTIIMAFPDYHTAAFNYVTKGSGEWSSNRWKISALKILGDHEVANALEEFLDKTYPHQFKKDKKTWLKDMDANETAEFFEEFQKYHPKLILLMEESSNRRRASLH